MKEARKASTRELMGTLISVMQRMNDLMLFMEDLIRTIDLSMAKDSVCKDKIDYNFDRYMQDIKMYRMYLAILAMSNVFVLMADSCIREKGQRKSKGKRMSKAETIQLLMDEFPGVLN